MINSKKFKKMNTHYLFNILKNSITVDSITFKILNPSLSRVKHMHTITNENLTVNLTDEKLISDSTNEDLNNSQTNENIYSPITKEDLTTDLNNIHLLACFSGFDLNFDNNALDSVEHKLNNYLNPENHTPRITSTLEQANALNFPNLQGDVRYCTVEEQYINKFIINIKSLHVEEKMMEQFLSLFEDLDTDNYHN